MYYKKNNSPFVDGFELDFGFTDKPRKKSKNNSEFDFFGGVGLPVQPKKSIKPSRNNFNFMDGINLNFGSIEPPKQSRRQPRNNPSYQWGSDFLSYIPNGFHKGRKPNEDQFSNYINYGNRGVANKNDFFSYLEDFGAHQSNQPLKKYDRYSERIGTAGLQRDLGRTERSLESGTRREVESYREAKKESIKKKEEKRKRKFIGYQPNKEESEKFHRADVREQKRIDKQERREEEQKGKNLRRVQEMIEREKKMPKRKFVSAEEVVARAKEKNAEARRAENEDMK